MKNQNLERLLLREAAFIQKYLMKIGARREDAEDITQDAICKAIEYIDAIQPDRMSAWLFRVSINGFYNLVKKGKKFVVVVDEATLENLQSDEAIEKKLIDNEWKDNVRRVLGQMKESYKNLIILRYFMDLSYKEIGAILDLDERTVKTYLYRARNSFKALWEETKYGRRP